MGSRTKGRQPDFGVGAEALAHMVRQRDAESEAARLLAARSNSILTLIVAVLGYGVWNLNALESVRPAALQVAMRAFLALSLILMLAALGVLLSPARTEIRDPLADSRLDVDADSLPGHMNRAKYMELARRRMKRSIIALGQQNAWGYVKTGRAQTLLLSAALCAGAGVVCYFWFTL